MPSLLLSRSMNRCAKQSGSRNPGLRSRKRKTQEKRDPLCSHPRVRRHGGRVLWPLAVRVACASPWRVLAVSCTGRPRQREAPRRSRTVAVVLALCTAASDPVPDRCVQLALLGGHRQRSHATPFRRGTLGRKSPSKA